MTYEEQMAGLRTDQERARAKQKRQDRVVFCAVTLWGISLWGKGHE